jgi:hypothetical protein
MKSFYVVAINTQDQKKLFSWGGSWFEMMHQQWVQVAQSAMLFSILGW